MKDKYELEADLGAAARRTKQVREVAAANAVKRLPESNDPVSVNTTGPTVGPQLQGENKR